MANGHDIELLFGVLGGGSLSGESGQEISKDLQAIISEINQKPLEIKVKMAESSGKSFSKQLTKLTKLANAGDISITVSNIDASKALENFKSQLKTMVNSLSIETGKTITIGTEVGMIKPDLDKLAADAEAAAKSVSKVGSEIKEINAMQGRLGARTNTLRNGLGATEEDIAKSETLRKKIVETSEEVARLNQMYKTGSGAEEIQAQIVKVQQLQSEMHKLIVDTQGKNNGSLFKGLKADIDAYKKALLAYKKDPAARKDVIFKDGEYQSKSGTYKALADELNRTKIAYDQVTEASKSLSLEQQKGISDYRIQKEREYHLELEQTANKERKAKEAARERAAAQNAQKVDLQKVIKLYNEVSEYITKNPRMDDSQRAQLEAIKNTLGGVIESSGDAKDGLAQMTHVDFSKQVKDFGIIRENVRATGKEGKTLGGIIMSAYQKFGGWMLVTRSLMLLVRQLKKMVTTVKEIDTAMTELKKVTDETDAAYARFLENAITRAKTVGASVKDVVSASADFARLGYDIGDAATLADTAIIYKNIGDGIEEISEASSSIISTMQAFGIEASEAMAIVDKFNEVGNNFAISSAGIGEALQRSAAAMKSANNTLDETIALITAANTVVQNPDSVGTALKTVSMYLRAAKTEAEDAGESTDGMADSVSDLREEILSLTGNKVDIQIDEDTFKSTYQILKELSEVWGNLSDVSQANLLELLGGKRNANVVSALIENFSVAEDVLKTSMDSTGSALAENEKYLDSIEGHVANFKASFEDLSTTLIDSELAKGVVDIGTGFMNALVWVGDLINKLGGLKTVLFSISGILAIKHADGMFEFFKHLPKTLNTAITHLGSFGKAFKETQELMALDGAGKIKTFFHSITAGFHGVAASISVVQLAVTGIVAAIGIGIALYQRYQQKQQEAIDKANELISAYNEVDSTYENNAESLKNLQDRFSELSDGVDQHGNNISLTTKQYDEFLDIISQIVDISPDICNGYDAEGRAVLNYKTALDDAVASQNQWLENERNIYIGSGRDIFDGKAKEFGKAKQTLSDAAYEITNVLRDYDIYEADFLKASKKISPVMDKYLEMVNAGQTSNWFSDTGFLTALYEDYDLVLQMMRGMTDESTGKLLYDENQISALKTSIMGLAGAYTELKAIEDEQINYLAEWSRDQSWYTSLPMGSITAFREALEEINDPTKSFDDNTQAVNEFGDALADALGNDAVIAVAELSKSLETGAITYDEYIAKIAELEATWGNLGLGSVDGNVWAAIESYLMSLGATFEDVTMSAAELKEVQLDTLISGTYEGLSGVTEKIDKLGDALVKLQDGSLGVSDVLSLMSEFPELAEYVDITADGFGNLDDGLRSVISKSPNNLIRTLKEFRITKDLTDDQAKSLDNMISYLEDLPSETVKTLTDDFGALGDAIRDSKSELTELEEALSGDDHDAGYEARVKYLEQLKQTLSDGEIGSKAYKALTEYFGLSGMSVDQVQTWINAYSKFFTEGEEGYKNFLSHIEEMNESGGLSADILSYDSETGLFNVDATKLAEAAEQLGMDQDILLDLIQKVRMYIGDWSMESQSYFDSFLSDGLLRDLDRDGTYKASLASVMEKYGWSEEEAKNIVGRINEELSSQGIHIDLLDDSTLSDWDGFNSAVDDATEETKLLQAALSSLGLEDGMINMLLNGWATFDNVLAPLLEQLGWTSEEIDTLKQKWDDFVEATNTPPGGQGTSSGDWYDSYLYRTGGGHKTAELPEEETVTATFVFDVNGEQVEAEVDLLVSYLEEQFGEDWQVELDSMKVIEANSRVGILKRLLDGLPPNKEVTITDNSGTALSNIGAISKYLDNICSKNGVSISVTWSETGKPHAALGTKHAKAGEYLLGEEYSSTGTPKPELVVSQRDGVYLAGVNGPEIRKLNAGDVVYTNSETEDILSEGSGSLTGLLPDVSFEGKKYNAPNTSRISGYKTSPQDSGGTIYTPDKSTTTTPNNTTKKPSSTESGDFETLYKKHQHLLEMDQESMEEYLKWLDDAYKAAYARGEIELDDFYKYQEEVYKGAQDLFKDSLDDIGHDISMLEGVVGSSDEIIGLAEYALSSIEKELEAARAAGLDENNEYIQYLEQQWSEYSGTVIDLREAAETEAKSTLDDLIDYRIDMIKQELENEKDALNERLDAVKEFYSEQKKLLQDAHDEEEYLEEQKAKRKTVSDIEIELARLESDNSAWAERRKLELNEALANAEKELNDFEKDHALDVALDFLDEQEAAQTEMIQAEIDAVDEILNDPHTLFNQALQDISNNTADMYEEFIQYNRKYGTGNDEDVKNMWESAYIADQEHKNTHGGASLNGIEIGNYTGYVMPETDRGPIVDGKPPSEDTNDTTQNSGNKPSDSQETYPYGKVSDVRKTLSVGSSGQDVKALQYALNQLGYGNSGTENLDGVFGGQTRTAVKNFQRAMGISADGVVGNDTKGKFRESGYASGTFNAEPGLKRVDELGPEWLFVSPSTGSRYRVFSGGEKVLNADGTNFLYNFAMTKGSIITDSIQKLLRDTFSGLRSCITGNTVPTSVTTGDIIIQGNADTGTVSEIRRAQRDQISTILKEFGRLRK